MGVETLGVRAMNFRGCDRFFSLEEKQNLEEKQQLMVLARPLEPTPLRDRALLA